MRDFTFATYLRVTTIYQGNVRTNHDIGCTSNHVLTILDCNGCTTKLGYMCTMGSSICLLFLPQCEEGRHRFSCPVSWTTAISAMRPSLLTRLTRSGRSGRWTRRLDVILQQNLLVHHVHTGGLAAIHYFTWFIHLTPDNISCYLIMRCGTLLYHVT